MSKRIWYETTTASKLLNLHRDTLLGQRRRGELEKGKHWKVKNPRAKRLTYLFNVSAIEKLRDAVVTEVETETREEPIAVQSAMLDGVEPYGITKAGEAVRVR